MHCGGFTASRPWRCSMRVHPMSLTPQGADDAPVVPLTYAEPFHVSSQLAFLDHITVGRAGWVVSEETRPEAAPVWGRPLVDGAAARARESRDGVEVVRPLTGRLLPGLDGHRQPVLRRRGEREGPVGCPSLTTDTTRTARFDHGARAQYAEERRVRSRTRSRSRSPSLVVNHRVWSTRYRYARSALARDPVTPWK